VSPPFPPHPVTCRSFLFLFVFLLSIFAWVFGGNFFPVLLVVCTPANHSLFFFAFSFFPRPASIEPSIPLREKLHVDCRRFPGQTGLLFPLVPPPQRKSPLSPCTVLIFRRPHVTIRIFSFLLPPLCSPRFPFVFKITHFCPNFLFWGCFPRPLPVSFLFRQHLFGFPAADSVFSLFPVLSLPNFPFLPPPTLSAFRLSHYFPCGCFPLDHALQRELADRSPRRGPEAVLFLPFVFLFESSPCPLSAPSKRRSNTLCDLSPKISFPPRFLCVFFFH